MANVKDVIEASRLYLGDLSATRYSETVMRVALNVALLAVNNDAGIDFTFNAGTNDITPTPSKLHKYLISLATAIVLIVGEETTAALDGGGAIWRSGISSISLGGYQKAIQEAGGKLRLLYNDAIIQMNMNSLTAESVDTYIKNATSLVAIN